MVDLNRRKFLKIILIGTGLLVIGKVFKWIPSAKAWTGPTGVAPNSNVAPPINTGSSAQTKSGDFTVQGTLHSSGKLRVPVGTDLYS
jgi:hypothetical protein